MKKILVLFLALASAAHAAVLVGPIGSFVAITTAAVATDVVNCDGYRAIYFWLDDATDGAATYTFRLNQSVDNVNFIAAIGFNIHSDTALGTAVLSCSNATCNPAILRLPEGTYPTGFYRPELSAVANAPVVTVKYRCAK
jgi:hypothetical protein